MLSPLAVSVVNSGTFSTLDELIVEDSEVERCVTALHEQFFS